MQYATGVVNTVAGKLTATCILHISQSNKMSGCSSGTILPDSAISQNKDGCLGDCVFCEV